MLHALRWDRLVGLCPSSLEINNPKNPLDEFLQALDYVNPAVVSSSTVFLEPIQSSEFFKKLKVLSLNMCDIKIDALIKLLARLHLLEGFAYQDVTFSRDDWNLVGGC